MKQAKQKIVTAVIAVGILCLAYAYFIEPHRLVVNQYEVKIKDWNPAFEGLRIATISDIHAGSNGVDEAKLRHIVETVNAQNVDLIVLLGDYVSQQRSEKPIRERLLKMEPAVIADNLAGMKAKYGVLVVLGNHDEWYDASAVGVEFERIGYNVLDGELALIEKEGQTLRILGLKDHTNVGIWKLYSDNARWILAGTEGTGDVLVLQHSPDIAPVLTGSLAVSKDLKLMLAGHSHGGQVWLPIVGRPIVPSGYGQKHAAGHFKHEGLDIFVTTGIGTSILPFRFMVPPEIAVMTIMQKHER